MEDEETAENKRQGGQKAKGGRSSPTPADKDNVSGVEVRWVSVSPADGSCAHQIGGPPAALSRLKQTALLNLVGAA